MSGAGRAVPGTAFAWRGDRSYCVFSPHAPIPMPYTPILATLGYVMSRDGTQALMIHRNTRPGDMHLGKYNGLGGKMEPEEDAHFVARREVAHAPDFPSQLDAGLRLDIAGLRRS